MDCSTSTLNGCGISVNLENAPALKTQILESKVKKHAFVIQNWLYIYCNVAELSRGVCFLNTVSVHTVQILYNPSIKKWKQPEKAFKAGPSVNFGYNLETNPPVCIQNVMVNLVTITSNKSGILKHLLLSHINLETYDVV